MPLVPKSLGSCLLPEILVNGTNKVVVSSISTTHGICPKKNGMLGRNARSTSNGTPTCARSERDRMNFARAGNVDPFLMAAQDSSPIERKTRLPASTDGVLPSTNSYPGGG